jgi:triosephosphate isomerase (TIM)
VVVCPPFVSLDAVAHALGGTAVRVGAQDVSDEGQGAFTGEVSAEMLASVGCAFCIVGHSERRQRHGESDDLVARKAARLLAAGLTPIVCVGETLEERRAGGAEAVVARQLDGALGAFSAEDAARVVVAYEPVWAIGTGETATPDQAQAMHASIRARLIERFGADVARAVPLLYGGSMNERNASDLLARPDVDGGLVGGASLKAEAFAEIVTAAGQAKGEGRGET